MVGSNRMEHKASWSESESLRRQTTRLHEGIDYLFLILALSFALAAGFAIVAILV